MIIQDDEVVQLNKNLREGLVALRAAEKQFGVEYTLQWRLAPNGNLQMTVLPAEDALQRDRA